MTAFGDLPRPGDRLGQYEILEPLGRGGMAAVFKARQPSLDRLVAIKVLPQGLAHDPQFVDRFHREARAIARLEHPNILPVYDTGQEGGITYIVMQYVRGGTLRSLMDDASIGLERRLEVTAQLCRALHAAHRQGIVHRDVKPGNVLLTEDGRPLLSDFGIAKVAEGTQLTQTGMGVGTAEYMSPEQAMGGELDGRSDVYSLGIVLFEMLAGRTPFRADTPVGVAMQHVSAPLPSLRDLTPAVPRSVQRLVERATAKDPHQRFATAEEMARALEKAVRGLGREEAEEPSEEPEEAATRLAAHQAGGQGRTQLAATGQGMAAALMGPPAGGMAGAGPMALPQAPARRRAGRGPWLLVAIVLLGAAALGGALVLPGLRGPSDAAGYLERARERGLRDSGGAMADLDKAIELDATHHPAYFQRAQLWQGLGYADRALEDLSRAVELAPEEPEYRLARAQLYAGLGRAPEANADLERTLALAPAGSALHTQATQLQAQVQAAAAGTGPGGPTLGQAEYVLYTARILPFSLEVPLGWKSAESQLEDGEPYVAFGSVDAGDDFYVPQGANFSVTLTRGRFASAAEAAAAYRSTLEDYPNVRLLPSAPVAGVAGVPGQDVWADWLDGQGNVTARYWIVAIVTPQGQTLLLSAWAPPALFETAFGRFQHMLSSLEFEGS